MEVFTTHTGNKIPQAYKYNSIDYTTNFVNLLLLTEQNPNSTLTLLHEIKSQLIKGKKYVDDDHDRISEAI